GLRLLFQFHPHPAAVRRLLLDEIADGRGRSSLKREYEVSLSSAQLRVLDDEIHAADHIFAASTYTAQTLIESGVSSDRISTIPYGVSARAQDLEARQPVAAGPLKILWVGSISQRKGLS